MEPVQTAKFNTSTPEDISLRSRRTGYNAAIARRLVGERLKYYNSSTKFIDDKIVDMGRLLVAGAKPLDTVDQGARDILANRGANELVLRPDEVPQPPRPFKPRPQA